MMYSLIEMKQGLNKMYTIKQMKKMATEKISRVFENVFGYIVFNPYEEREYMIVALIGHYATEIIEQLEEVAKVEPAWNEETESIGMRVYHHMVDKIFAAMRNVWTPVREETKGRKSRFSYNDVWDMIYADIQGMKLSEIAQYYQTTSAVVYQILTGLSYQWASGITQESF